MHAEFQLGGEPGDVRLRVVSGNGDQTLLLRMIATMCAQTAAQVEANDDGTELTVRAHVEQMAYTSPDDFAECWSCRGRVGVLTLCMRCAHNRTLIARQSAEIDKLRAETKRFGLRVEDLQREAAARDKTIAELRSSLDSARMRGVVYGQIVAERAAQDRQWGGPDHDDSHTMKDWVAFVREHAMRAAKNAARDPDEYRKQMIEIAALAVAAVESFDRKATS